MDSLEDELETARGLSVAELADAVESIGFECTRCGACCTADGSEPHTATAFPDEVRRVREGEPAPTDANAEEWRDVARPMPYGLTENENGDLEGETLEWALQTDACGDCVFYEESADGTGACGVHEDRPLICQTYPFSVALAGTSQPMGEPVDSVALSGHRASDEGGVVRAHECEGLERDISRADAEDLAAALKERAIRELEEAIALRDAYEPVETADRIVVHDSEGPKRIDGTPIETDP